MAFRPFLFLLSLLLAPPWSHAAEDFMDQYLSVPGSYTFVRRAPEGAMPDRVQMTIFEDFLCPACYHTATKLIPPLKKKYGDRLEVRFFGYPFIHPQSRNLTPQVVRGWPRWQTASASLLNSFLVAWTAMAGTLKSSTTSLRETAITLMLSRASSSMAGSRPPNCLRKTWKQSSLDCWTRRST